MIMQRLRLRREIAQANLDLKKSEADRQAALKRKTEASNKLAALASLLVACFVLCFTGCSSVPSLPSGGGDKNFFSITGDDAGNIWINDAFAIAADQPGMREITLPPIVAPAGYADALKFSGVRRLRVNVPQVDGRQAAEDAIDINHCAELEVAVGDLWPGQTYCATIKGASSSIGIVVARQHGHGRETDYDYGNASDQGNAPTRDCLLSVRTVDNSPAAVRLLSAEPVTFPNAAVQGYAVDARAQGWFYPVYNFAKDLLRSIGVKI